MNESVRHGTGAGRPAISPDWSPPVWRRCCTATLERRGCRHWRAGLERGGTAGTAGRPPSHRLSHRPPSPPSHHTHLIFCKEIFQTINVWIFPGCGCVRVCSERLGVRGGAGGRGSAGPPTRHTVCSARRPCCCIPAPLGAVGGHPGPVRPGDSEKGEVKPDRASRAGDQPYWAEFLSFLHLKKACV